MSKNEVGVERDREGLSYGTVVIDFVPHWVGLELGWVRAREAAEASQQKEEIAAKASKK